MPAMSTTAQHRLDALRAWRNRAEPDRGLSFLVDYHKRHIERPARQLADLAEMWEQLVPPHLLNRTRLESFSRGVLRVAVDSSPHLYELDHLLRNGLQRSIARLHGPAMHRIRLRVAPV